MEKKDILFLDLVCRSCMFLGGGFSINYFRYFWLSLSASVQKADILWRVYSGKERTPRIFGMVYKNREEGGFKILTVNGLYCLFFPAMRVQVRVS